jgi:hypothetical protein
VRYSLVLSLLSPSLLLLLLSRLLSLQLRRA